MAGLVAGGAKYADMKMDEKQKAEDAQRQQKLMDLQRQLMQANAIFKTKLEPPKINTIEDTGPDGQTIKRTIRSTFDPESLGYTDEEIGKAVVPAKDDRSSIEREYELSKRDPKGYAAMKQAGRRPAGDGSGGASDRVTFEEYSSWPQERKDAYDRYKGRAIKPDEDAKDRKWVTNQTAVAMRDFNKKPAYEQEPLLKSAGIDPSDPDAAKKYRNSIRDDLKTQMGIDLFQGSVSSGVSTTAKDKPAAEAAPAAKGTSRENPAPAEAFKEKPPSGTWVKLPSGQVIQIP